MACCQRGCWPVTCNMPSWRIKTAACLQTMLWTRSNAGTWQWASYPVSKSLIGRTVRVLFGVYNDGNGRSSVMFVDDVALDDLRAAHADGDCHTDTFTHPDADPDADRDGHPDRHGDAPADRDDHLDPDGDTDAYTH